VHHVAQQLAAGIAGAEHDDPPFVLTGCHMTTAPAADNEANGEHADQCKGPSDNRNAAGHDQGVGQEGPDQQPAGGGQNGDGEVDGLLEGTTAVADRIGADDHTHDEVSDRGDAGEQESVIHQHVGVREVEPQPGGGIDRDEPDRPIEQHPHPPVQPRARRFLSYRHKDPPAGFGAPTCVLTVMQLGPRMLTVKSR
jgi:hypothetical protein